MMLLALSNISFKKFAQSQKATGESALYLEHKPISKCYCNHAFLSHHVKHLKSGDSISIPESCFPILPEFELNLIIFDISGYYNFER